MKILSGFGRPVSMAPAGVVPLSGGDVGCVAISLVLGVGSCFRVKALVLWSGMMAASATSFLSWEYRARRLSSCWRSSGVRRGPDRAHLALCMVVADEFKGSWSCCSLEVFGVNQDAARCFGFGQVFPYCSCVVVCCCPEDIRMWCRAMLVVRSE
ncbi:hypothetical protein VPH35_093796 [Triticum aestivum]